MKQPFYQKCFMGHDVILLPFAQKREHYWKHNGEMQLTAIGDCR